MNGLPPQVLKNPRPEDTQAKKTAGSENQAKITYSKGSRGKGQAGPTKQTRPKV